MTRRVLFLAELAARHAIHVATRRLRRRARNVRLAFTGPTGRHTAGYLTRHAIREATC